MKTLLMSVINGMDKSEHTKPLLTKQQLQLCIVSEDGMWNIFFDGESPRFIENETSDVVIEGSNDALTQLIRGEDFLLAMRRREELNVTGSLKHLLWLESLFYLTNVT